VVEPDDDEREASRAYRGLPREEPPARLDDAVRAAARREAQARPAPLVAPTGRRRWYFPVAAAAVVVLAVAVTSQVEREQAQPTSNAAPERSKKEDVPAQEPKAAPKPERRLNAPAESRPSLQDFGRDRLSRDEAPRPQPSAPASSPPAQAPPVTMEAQGSLAPKAAQAEMRAKSSLQNRASPESELERIAELRRQGKDEEADRALAEFRKRHPDYRIAPGMLEKVEKK